MKKKFGLHVPLPVAVMLLMMLATDRSGVCLLTVLAAFLHEAGHLLAARALHIPLGDIRLDFFGARIEITGRMLSYGEEWILCAAGPISSLLFAAFGALFWHFSEYFQIFSCASLVLGVLNLLPIRTFDGGRMLECALTCAAGERTAGAMMRICSFLFLFLLWSTAVYLLLRAGDGLSLLCFSMSLFFRFFDGEK